MHRRAFLAAGGRTAVATLAAATGGPNLLFARDRTLSSDALEQRIADVVAAFDAQGNHRTGTPVDNASQNGWRERYSNWASSLSSNPSRSTGLIRNRVTCASRIGASTECRYSTLPSPTGKECAVGSDLSVAMLRSGWQKPSRLRSWILSKGKPRSRKRGGAATRRSSCSPAAADPELFLLNAGSFSKPIGPPTVQVSSIESEWLKEQAQQRAEATLVAHVSRAAAQAFNVAVKIAGSNPALAPLVLMAPRSGWWQCASEQGSRLACWLEAIRVLATGRPARDSFFVALSGHELGFLGIDAYLKRRGDLVKRAHMWIFFGSDIGAPGQPNLIHASDDELEQWAVLAMEKEGLTVNAKERHGSAARGEARAVQQGGGRFVTLVCGSDLYHNVTDRWPEALDVATLARYASALANGALEVAKQRS